MQATVPATAAPMTVASGTIGQIMKGIENIPIMELMLFVTLTVVIILLALMQMKRDKYDLRSLITNDTTKRPSLQKLGQAIAMLVSTWGFIVLIERNLLTEWYYALYMAVWSGNTALHKYLDNKEKQTTPGGENGNTH
jgi:hypothetical protein